MAGAIRVSAQIEVAADSRVGIGTSTPEEKVDVRDANGGRVQFDPADGAIEIGSGNDAISYIDFKGSANLGSDYHGRILYADGSGFEMAVAGGLSAIKVAENGNVGVGTTALSHKFTVSGSVRATSFIADVNTYADFVFKPGYRLAPLSEVEAHIQAYDHLPDIPSEAEAREQGIDFASMQVELLQKNEKLTLHVIALKKENEAQRRQLGTLG